jgi:hypothetical protein
MKSNGLQRVTLGLKEFTARAMVDGLIARVCAAPNVAAIRVAPVFESQGLFLSGLLVTAGNGGNVYPGVPTCF